jgi:hypothetical protein
MIFWLAILLRLAGAGLLALAAVHIPIGRHLQWRTDAARMAPVNTSIFHVHTLFICLMLVLMGLPCLLDPQVLLEKSRAGAWLAWSFASFWAVRLYCQWYVYPRELWRGKRLETSVHVWFTLVWLSLTTLFAICGARQSGWLAL